MALRDGPEIAGVKARPEIGKGVMTLRVARHGRRGSHFLMFHLASASARELEVLRVLHEAMDPQHHLPE